MNDRELINKILDQAKADRGFTSDLQLARSLGLSHMAITRWRKRGLRPQSTILLKLQAEQKQRAEPAQSAA